MILSYERPHNLTALADELFQAVPSLASIINADGEREAVAQICGDGEVITIHAADELLDDATRAAIDVVIAKHTNPAEVPPPPSRDEKLRAVIEDGIAELSKASTVASLRAQMQTTLQKLGEALA